MRLNRDMPFDDSFDDIGVVVGDVTRIIDEEVRAFQDLLDSVQDHKSLTFTHEDGRDVLLMEAEETDHSQAEPEDDKYQRLHRCREMISSRLLVMIEQRSIERMNELKDILYTLQEKLQKKNPQWIHPIQRSIQALDQSICLLTRNTQMVPCRPVPRMVHDEQMRASK
jgi:hypothetical protein